MDILGVIREEGRVWGLVARRERKAATLCVGVRERRELYPNGSDDRENTQEEVGSSACPEPVAATSAGARQPPSASSQGGEPALGQSHLS